MSLESQLKKYRISNSEHEKMKTLLGREVAPLEWALFSALWSEHCSYKSSKIHLRKFSYRNKNTPDLDGENAGVVDLGQGEKIIFKMESHNHPSFIEPFQGAATGVGGILRDIFTMGARPIALANYLCFGELEAPRMKSIVKGVVSGISHYGNCVGVPTITGRTQFHKSYNKNVLVNALAVGLISKEHNKMALSEAQGVGNLVVYVGAKTGVDGVHGASMASESFTGDSEAKRPNVQIGDPFFEKLLIESCLEILSKDLVVAMQDMGAAGLTSSSFEMASKGKCGMEMDLAQVPLRNAGMTPEEILLSESQERMLLIAEPSKLEQIKAVFGRWGLDACVIGQVINERKMKLKWGTETLCEIDPHLLTENAPRYERPYESLNLPKWEAKNLNEQESTYKLNRSSKKWVYRQYDQRVGAATAHDCSFQSGLVELPDTKRGLTLSLGSRAEVFAINPAIAAYDAFFHPLLQMSIKGAHAMATTDCMNFGNPEKKNIMSEFVYAVEAFAQCAKVFEAPVISGNVSFYNETEGQNILSTPAIGMVGLRKDVKAPSDFFKTEGDQVLVLTLNVFSKEFLGLMDETHMQKIKMFSDFLIGHSDHFTASLLVGMSGLQAAVVKMSGACTLANLEKLETNPQFYQVVLATSKENFAGLVSEVQNLKKQIAELSYQELGSLVKNTSKVSLPSVRALEDYLEAN